MCPLLVSTKIMKSIGPIFLFITDSVKITAALIAVLLLTSIMKWVVTLNHGIQISADFERIYNYTKLICFILLCVFQCLSLVIVLSMHIVDKLKKALKSFK
jgi:hypothetical protein